MSTVLLGSEAPKAPAQGAQASVNNEGVKSDESVSLPARTAVLIDTPDLDSEGNKIPLDKKLLEIRNAFALHSDKTASWVEGTEKGFTDAVSQVFDCKVGRPDDWDAKPTAESEVNENPDDGVMS